MSASLPRTRVPRVSASGALLGIWGLLAASGCTSVNPSYCDPATGPCPAATPDLAGTGIDPGADLRTEGTAEDLAPNPTGVDLWGPPADMRMDVATLDPSKPGPRKTANFDLTVPIAGGSMQTTVYGPSEDGKALSKMGAPFPLVVLSPGFTLDRKLFSSYAERLASYGFVAVLSKASNETNHARYRDGLIDELDWLVDPQGRGSDSVDGRVNKDKIGLVGHSLGGKISALVAAQDRRVKAYLGLDPVDSNNPPALAEVGKIMLPTGTPFVVLGELTNKTVARLGVYCAPAMLNFEAFYDRAASPAIAITMVNASHLDFIDPGRPCGVACSACPPAPMSPAPAARTNQLAVKYTTAYFLWTLGGDARAKPYLSGTEIQKDVTAGYVTRVEK